MPRVIDSDSDEFSSDAEMDDVDIEAIEAAEAEYANNGKRKLTAADKGKGKEAAKKGKGADNAYAWEGDLERSWDAVQEDESGSIEHSVEGMMARGRRRRQQHSAPTRRTIIRHLIILLDLSDAMSEKDLRPSRFDLTIEYVKEFVSEWFDQNPLGQIGIIALRAGVAERLVEMGGNPQEILRVLQDKKKLEPSGEPSLQNGLEMARGSMSHLPNHSSREVLLLLASLTSCDPGSITTTLSSLVTSKIRVSVVCLAAETKLAKDLSTKTGGTFGVALNEGHLKDLVWEAIPPPALTSAAAGLSAAAGGTGGGGRAAQPASDLMMMGFPTRLPETGPPTLCACHALLKPEGFLCPRCGAKLCDVPTDCDVCGLLVVSSPHLARSYHHLFPVGGWSVVPFPPNPHALAPTCLGCAVAFPLLPSRPPPPSPGAQNQAADDGAISPTGRYRCRKCGNDFCGECDAFVHEVLHVCPGC